jgi:hypothetical protein
MFLFVVRLGSFDESGFCSIWIGKEGSCRWCGCGDGQVRKKLGKQPDWVTASVGSPNLRQRTEKDISMPLVLVHKLSADHGNVAVH